MKKGYTRFQERDVLVAKITPSMENGKAAVARGLVGGVGAGTTEFHVLRPTAAVLPAWLFYQVVNDDFRKAARSQMTGTAGQLRVPSRFYEQRETPVAPLPEQHRIVDAIESYFTRLDDAVATLERVQRNLKRYRASVFQAAVEGRLVPTEAKLASADGRDYEHASVLLDRILVERRRRWEEAELAKMQAKGRVPKDDMWKAKYKEPVAPDTPALRELPEGWVWASIEQLLLSMDQGWSPKCERRPVSTAEEWGIIKTSSVQPMTYAEAGNKALPINLLPRPHLQVHPGDILVTRAGPRTTM